MKFLYLIFALLCFVKANEEVICPDFRSKCPGGTTCCTLDSGDFGCCPLPKAVCCSDHVHCCPENNKCDVERQLCLHTNEGGIITSQPLRRKVPSTKMYEVICPDGKHSCPAHHTCCPIGSKKQFWKVQYGCCPAEKAVCCSDHLHCCPHGTECDISEARCLIPPILRETEIRKLPPFSIQHKKDVPSERKIKAESMEPAVRLCGLQFIDAITGSVRAQKFCPVTTKCCSYPYYDDEIGTVYERELGCCPFKDGNCCRYSRKCCPKGFECTKDNKCISIENYESQEEKEVVEPISTSEHYEYPSLFPSLPSCPDRSKCVPPGGDITSRKDTTTCCPRYDNNKLIVGYDCCPEKKANCCSNRTCCPYGYACINSSKNGNVSSCKRMTMKEVIAKLFLH